MGRSPETGGGDRIQPSEHPPADPTPGSNGVASQRQPDDHWEVAKQAFLTHRLPYALPDDPAREKWRRLLSFLTDRSTPGGKTLEVPRLTLEATADGWKVTLQHYTLSYKLVIAIDYLHEMWDELEARFSPGSRGWSLTKTGEAAKKRQSDETNSLAKHHDPVYDLAKGGGDPRKQG